MVHIKVEVQTRARNRAIIIHTHTHTLKGLLSVTVCDSMLLSKRSYLLPDAQTLLDQVLVIMVTSKFCLPVLVLRSLQQLC